MSNNLLKLKIIKKTTLPGDVIYFSLADERQGQLPSYSPGAHIQLQLPSGLRRNYSLLGDGSDLFHYEIGVKRLANGRGGSKELIDGFQVGDFISVREPDNFFPLIHAKKYLFIAGGIGITPILSFIKYLKANQHLDFRLVYCTRNKDATPFLDWIAENLNSEQYQVHHDDGNPQKAFDFWSLLGQPTQENIYCCGPRSLMDDVQAMTGHWEEGTVHFEDFGSDSNAESILHNEAFTIVHQSTGKEYLVGKEQTIIEALRKEGVDLASSCESGTCGTCKTKYFEGEVEHRDLVLSVEERKQFVMICVSRAKSSQLVLDW